MKKENFKNLDVLEINKNYFKNIPLRASRADWSVSAKCKMKTATSFRSVSGQRTLLIDTTSHSNYSTGVRLNEKCNKTFLLRTNSWSHPRVIRDIFRDILYMLRVSLITNCAIMRVIESDQYLRNAGTEDCHQFELVSTHTTTETKFHLNISF